MPLNKDIEQIPKLPNLSVRSALAAVDKMTGVDDKQKAAMRRDIRKASAMLPALAKDRRQLNSLIADYNRNKRPQNLDKVIEARKAIIAKYPDSLIEHYPFFHQHFHVALEQDIRLQPSYKPPSFGDGPTNVLAQIIDEMPDDKASELTAILMSWGEARRKQGGQVSEQAFRDKLQNLYAPNDPGYTTWCRFLDNYTIDFLGGCNSKNFELIHKDSGEKCVLKVDYRLGMPRAQEQKARQVLPGVVTSVPVERVCRFMYSQDGPEIGTARGLVLTEHCAGSDIDYHGREIPNSSQRREEAINIFGQMGQILEKLRKNQMAHPDMKNTNWLVENGQVRIADTKAFVPTTRGKVDILTNKANYYGYVSTSFLNPPEIYQRDALDADKLHVCMMGKNLYQFLTGCSPSYLYNTDPVDYEYEHEIFKTKQGLALKELIQEMTLDDPKQRPTMADVNRRLQNIAKLSATAGMPHQGRQTRTTAPVSRPKADDLSKPHRVPPQSPPGYRWNRWGLPVDPEPKPQYNRWAKNSDLHKPIAVSGSDSLGEWGKAAAKAPGMTVIHPARPQKSGQTKQVDWDKLFADINAIAADLDEVTATINIGAEITALRQCAATNPDIQLELAIKAFEQRANKITNESDMANLVGEIKSLTTQLKMVNVKSVIDRLSQSKSSTSIGVGKTVDLMDRIVKEVPIEKRVEAIDKAHSSRIRYRLKTMIQGDDKAADAFINQYLTKEQIAARQDRQHEPGEKHGNKFN